MKRTTREQALTAEEAATYEDVRAQVAAEHPPADPRVPFQPGVRVRIKLPGRGRISKVFHGKEGTVTGWVGLMILGAIWVKVDGREGGDVPFGPEELELIE